MFSEACKHGDYISTIIVFCFPYVSEMQMLKIQSIETQLQNREPKPQERVTPRFQIEVLDTN